MATIIPSINILKEEESNWNKINNIYWDRSALCSKFHFRAYSDPSGADAKSLKVQIDKSIGLQGCEITNIESAFKFEYNFEEKKAELLINKSAITITATRATIPLILTGKYGFKDNVLINLTHIPRLYYRWGIGNSEYQISPKDEKIAELTLYSDSFQDGDSIDVKIEKTSSCIGFVHFCKDAPSSFSIHPNEEKKIGIEIEGEKFPKGLSEKHICEFELLLWDSPTTIQLILLPGDNCKNITPEKNEVVVSLKNNIKVESTKDEITVFTEMPPRELNLNVKAINFDAKIVDIHSECKLVMFDDKFPSLTKNSPQQLTLKVLPDNVISTQDITVFFLSDYSLPYSKKLKIKTKDSIPPKTELKIVEELKIYYLGQGKVSFGKLKIKCTSECPNKDQVRPLHINTKDIVCKLTPFVTIENEEKEIVLSLGEEKLLDIYFEATENNWELPIGETIIDVKCGDSTIKKTLTVKKQILEPLKFYFKEIDPFTLTYDDSLSLLQIGTLETSYAQHSKEIQYKKREKGKFSLSYPSLCFANRNKDQILEPGDSNYPVYSLLKERNKNKELPQNLKILYKDNLEEKSTDIIALPILEISWIDPQGEKNVIPNDLLWNPVDIETYHVFSSNLRNQGTQKCFEIVLSNKQNLAQNNNRLFISSLSCKNNPEYISLNSANITLFNGSEPAALSFIIDYNKLPLPLPESVELELSFAAQIIVDNGNKNTRKRLDVHLRIKLLLKELIYDNWYSIDLGTTGIVVAKWDYSNNQIGPIVLKDEDKVDERIEKDDNIISSNTILKKTEERTCSIAVSPSLTDWKQSDNMLVPCKFIVGQDHIPYSNIFAKEFPNGAEFDGGTKKWESLSPSDIIEYTYKTIFNKIDNTDREKVRKLIVTYPNTYTPILLGWLRNLILKSKLFPYLDNENLHLIPESDSVVAFYIYKKISSEGFNLKPNKVSKMVIYDMGAGTLDLSLVEMTNTGNGINANFVKRIGIPIAGEFFTYLLYKQYEGKWYKVDKELKIFLEKVKCHFKDNKKLDEYDSTQNYLKNDYKDEETLIGRDLSEWINICTENVFCQLVGNNWKDDIDLIVFSGRGSQFSPIRNAIIKSCKDKNIIIDESSITNQELKQCVAHGAILYQQIFQNVNRPFNIKHHNTCYNIGVEFTTMNDNYLICREYKQILGIDDFREENIEINGSYFSSYKPISKTFDFSEDGEVIFYITSLSEDIMKDLINKREDKRWCFVSNLFSFHTSLLGVNNPKRKQACVHVETDSNNSLFLKVNDIDLNKKATIENIENNKFYKSCNWFINNNK